MRILHCVLILAFAILLKNVYYSSSLLKPRPQVKYSYIHVQQKLKSYTLVAQWPPGVCSNVTCEIKEVPTEFTIHGLWENGYCTPSTKTFNAEELTNITEQLNKTWPNLNGTNSEFWKYQWNKHGKRCGMGLYKYFNKTLELFEDDDRGLKAKLADENIIPSISKTYKLQDIEAALKKINGNFACKVICNHRNTDKKEANSRDSVQLYHKFQDAE